jgi:eukaryotic-like serine/threonine-protein kinase
LSDADALGWLDRLLAESAERRAQTLNEIARANPQLHARLTRLLASALSPEHSRLLVQPVVAGMERLSVTAALELAADEVLAGYRLIRELGRGGMSVVWLAERADGVVKRQVALKMPMFVLRGAGDVERFTRERDALASLSHANVARLYDAGLLPSGQPFIVLEYVDGVTLLEYGERHRLDVPARLRLFLQVLAAVEHAHKHLVVHRDLKPSNILVDTEGQVKLLDFGIAKLLGEREPADAALTRMQGGALTPLYAAPEQIHGATISTLTDVYSLGVLLHELLTGVLPYRAAPGMRPTLVEVLETLGRGELPRASLRAPDDLRPTLSGDLDTIISKAVRLTPDDRYASVKHLADDLQRYLDRRPISARPPRFWYSVRLAFARHRLASGVAAAGLLLVVIASAVAVGQYRASRANAERTAAVRDFMFDLVNDAEAVEGHEGEEVTGRQMIEGAVIRARRDFGAQPQLQGELLGELGRMYWRLGAPEAAAPVLAESVAILEKHAPPEDAALNKARAFLAHVQLQAGEEREGIRVLAAHARDSCANTSVDCAKARAYAANILSQLAAVAGDDETALAEMRRSAADVERAFGAVHEETASALMSVAMIARNAGHLAEAGDAMGRAAGIAQGLRLRAVDRAEIERSMAVIDLDLGRYAQARDRLKATIERTNNDAERSLLYRLLATVYIELGDSAEALKIADMALASIPAEDPRGQKPYAQQARARALSLAGRHPAALAGIDAVIARFLADGSQPDSFEVQRAQRYRADFLVRSGSDADALAALRDLRDRQAARTSSPVERGLVLDALGQAERKAGNGQKSQLAHEAARTELLKQLPVSHPYVIRNAALLKGA